MDKSQKIVEAFRKKFDAMTPCEREQYLQKMGLKYRKNSYPVEIKLTEKKPFVIAKAGCVYSSIPHTAKIQKVDGKFVYIMPNGEIVTPKSAKHRASRKKQARPVKLKK